MESKDRGASLAEDVLTRSFRHILKQSGVDKQGLAMLIEFYLDPTGNMSHANNSESTNKLANDRGNIKKEIEKGKMTFKVLLKLIKILRCKKFKVTFTGEWADGLSFNNGYELNLDDLENIEITDEELESFQKKVEDRGGFDLDELDDDDDQDKKENPPSKSAW